MIMEVSIPNENGVLAAGLTQIVATLGRSYAAVNIALGEDGRYRYSVSLRYSYGGFGGPICAQGSSFADIPAARTAALEELLRRWHEPYPSDPQSVREELRLLREQVVAQVQQPSLF